MPSKLYKKYFQKSKSFLYPALGIKKNSPFFPVNTYIAIDKHIVAEECKLICKFKKNDSDKFKDFERDMLVENPLYICKIEEPDHIIYVFDYQIYVEDWLNFMAGKYSKLSTSLKRAIKEYYKDGSAEYEFIKTYLYPEEYFTEFAELLDIDFKELEKIGELCNPYDSEKETLKISIEHLECLDNLI
jgi:hypothetical protein